MENSGRVLLIEDEPLIAMSMQDSLEGDGYCVELVYDGSAAIEYLGNQQELCGIVTDIRLGQGPDGWEVARRARDNEPRLPVVYVSGDSAHDFFRQSVPGSLMLQKPFRSADLLTALSNAIHRSAERH